MNPALVDALRRLRAGAPDAYRYFIEVYSEHDYQVTVAVISAAQTDILAAQGRAQHSRDLLEMIKESMEDPAARPSQ